jgi:hypothetical protein
MNNRINWITHNDKKILFLNFSDSTVEESTKIWVDVESDILNYKGALPLLMLLDVKNVKYDMGTQNAYRKVRDASKNIPQKWAIVNASTATMVMIKIICLFVKDNIIFTDTIDSAKDKLARE